MTPCGPKVMTAAGRRSASQAAISSTSDVERLVGDAAVGVAVEDRDLVEADGPGSADELRLALVAEGRVGNAVRGAGLAAGHDQQARGVAAACARASAPAHPKLSSSGWASTAARPPGAIW